MGWFAEVTSRCDKSSQKESNQRQCKPFTGGRGESVGRGCGFAFSGHRYCGSDTVFLNAKECGGILEHVFKSLSFPLLTSHKF